MTYSLMPSSFIGAEGGRNGQREKERVGGGSYKAISFFFPFCFIFIFGKIIIKTMMKISLSVESETTSTFGFGAHLFAGSRRFHRHRMCFVFQLFFSLSLSLSRYPFSIGGFVRFYSLMTRKRKHFNKGLSREKG